MERYLNILMSTYSRPQVKKSGRVVKGMCDNISI